MYRQPDIVSYVYFLYLSVFCCTCFGLSHCNKRTLVSDQHNLNTRAAASHKLLVPNVHLSVCRKAFKYRGPQLWNLVEDDITEKESLDSFKRSIRSSDLFKVIN